MSWRQPESKEVFVKKAKFTGDEFIHIPNPTVSDVIGHID